MPNRYRVLRGIHCEGQRAKDTNKLIVYRPGDVFESEKELHKTHNSPGSVKFELVSNEIPLSRTPLIKAVPKEAEPQMTAKDFESLTVDELKKYAEQEEIDLGNLSKKADIIARLLQPSAAVV